MPVLPEKKPLYPWDWVRIATQVKRRAGWRCERCGLLDGAVVRRKIGAPDVVLPANEVLPAQSMLFFPSIRIVLAAAHLDSSLESHDYSNLAALCQRCHLLLDRPRRDGGEQFAVV